MSNRITGAPWCSTPLIWPFSQMTPYVRQRRISQNLNHLREPLNWVWVVFYRRRLTVSTLISQWLQVHGNRRVPSPVFLVVTNRLGDLLAVVRSSLDLQEAEGGAASVARSPPVVLISLNDNYCLNFHTALNSVKEPNVGFVPARTFCSKCKFCFKQPEASAKERSRSSCKPDK